MLKKLIKYEWKAVWKIMVIINAFTVFATTAGMCAMRALVSDTASDNGFYMVITILIFLFYYATIIGVSFAMTIYIGIRFYRSMYTDEGYLMHTLPVTKNQLIVSRLLVHMLCMMITSLLVMVSVALLLLPLFAEIFNTSSLTPSHMLTELMENGIDAYGIPLVVSTFSIGIIGNIISLTSGILSIYCAISLGQTFHKHKVMGSILCYIGIYCMLQTINSMLMMPQMMSSISGIEINMMSYFHGTMLTASIFALITGILFYLITLYMMDKRLNLD